MRVERELHIVKGKHQEFDLFFCAKCHEWKNKRINESPTTTEERVLFQKYTDYLHHREKVKFQWNYYLSILESLKTNRTTCLVVIDFTKKFTQQAKAVICSMVKFQQTTNGEVKWVALDFCGISSSISAHLKILLLHNIIGKSGNESADNYFLQGVWQSAFRLGLFSSEIKNIHIFHDKGSNELYNSSILYLYSSLASTYERNLFAHYFESCHGKSICDSHFGQTTKKGNRLLQYLKPEKRYNHIFW